MTNITNINDNSILFSLNLIVSPPFVYLTRFFCLKSFFLIKKIFYHDIYSLFLII